MAAPRLVRRTALAVASCAVAWAGAEGLLWALDVPKTDTAFHTGRGAVDVYQAWWVEFDPELFWRFQPGTHRIHAPEGLRGWLPRQAKTERHFRIACVGDSNTFGVGARYEDTYGKRLERALRPLRPGYCVESILAGTPGYSTHQSLILWRREVEHRRPDVTILYLGAWNDYQPAVGANDLERARRMASKSRLLELVRRAVDPPWSDDPADYEEAFRRGEVPDGPRVPLDKFVANVEELIGLARSASRETLLVVPPLPAHTLEDFPSCADYQAAVRDVARRLQVTAIDAPALFAEYMKGPEPAPLFVDSVHPSGEGHRIIAEALLPHVLAAAPPERTAELVRSPSVANCDPGQIEAIAEAWVTLTGSGFSAPGAFDRLWIGPRWIESFEVVDDRTLRAHVVRGLPPGDHPVFLVTARGLVTAPQPLRAVAPTPPMPEVTLKRIDAERFEIHVTVSCCGESLVAAWVAPGVLETPVQTEYGPFSLSGPNGETPLEAGSPFRDFAGLPWTRLMGESGRPGWGMRQEIPAAQLTGLRRIHVQGLVVDAFDPNVGVVTTVVAVDVPE